MFGRSPIKWSPVEVDYLKANRSKMSENQLSLALAKTRAAIKRKLDELDGKPQAKGKNKRTKIGKRKDLGVFLRSGWEANFARFLNYHGTPWKYEPRIFSFLDHGVKKGTVTYCPDFEVDGKWIELKGYLDGKGRTAIRRFKKFYPEEFNKLTAIVGRPGTAADKFFKKEGVPVQYYSDLTKEYKKKIPSWE